MVYCKIFCYSGNVAAAVGERCTLPERGDCVPTIKVLNPGLFGKEILQIGSIKTGEQSGKASSRSFRAHFDPLLVTYKYVYTCIRIFMCVYMTHRSKYLDKEKVKAFNFYRAAFMSTLFFKSASDDKKKVYPFERDNFISLIEEDKVFVPLIPTQNLKLETNDHNLIISGVMDRKTYIIVPQDKLRVTYRGSKNMVAKTKTKMLKYNGVLQPAGMLLFSDPSSPSKEIKKWNLKQFKEMMMLAQGHWESGVAVPLNDVLMATDYNGAAAHQVAYNRLGDDDTYDRFDLYDEEDKLYEEGYQAGYRAALENVLRQRADMRRF